MTIERNSRMARHALSGAALVAAVAAQVGFAAAAASERPGEGRDEIGIQGRWAYSRQAAPDAVIDMATTPASQDPDVWLLLACSGEGRLSVALMHTERFAFEVDASSAVQVESTKLSTVRVVAERFRPAQIVMDPTLVQHIMPLLVEEQDLSVSVTARDGVAHRYTFQLQPNDVALAPLRSRCSGS
jgi:hypothetical protein